MWVLGLYELSWPTNGSFEYVNIFFFFSFWWGVGGGRNIKGEAGIVGGWVEEVT